MINVRELRPGNLVLRWGAPTTICGTQVLDHTAIVLFWDGNTVDQFGCQEIHPIPITPEWLERCGFIQQSDWYLLDEGRGLMYAYNDDGGIYGFYIVTEYANLTEWNPRPLYLHQLQNLYFALTGEELQIKDL